MSPINLIDCSLEDWVGALLHEHPIAMPEGGSPFILENDSARRIFAYYARRRDLWPRARQVQARGTEEVLKALDQDPPVKKATDSLKITNAGAGPEEAHTRSESQIAKRVDARTDRLSTRYPGAAAAPSARAVSRCPSSSARNSRIFSLSSGSDSPSARSCLA